MGKPRPPQESLNLEPLIRRFAEEVLQAALEQSQNYAYRRRLRRRGGLPRGHKAAPKECPKCGTPNTCRKYRYVCAACRKVLSEFGAAWT